MWYKIDDRKITKTERNGGCILSTVEECLLIIREITRNVQSSFKHEVQVSQYSTRLGIWNDQRTGRLEKPYHGLSWPSGICQIAVLWTSDTDQVHPAKETKNRGKACTLHLKLHFDTVQKLDSPSKCSAYLLGLLKARGARMAKKRSNSRPKTRQTKTGEVRTRFEMALENRHHVNIMCCLGVERVALPG